MSEPKGTSSADRLAAAEGEAAVEAIAEAEAPEATPSTKGAAPRRRRTKAAEAEKAATDVAAGEPPTEARAAQRTDGSGAAPSAGPVGADLVPVMAPEDTIRAESVTITQGGAVHVEAGILNVTQGGVQDARADRIEVRQGGVGRAEVDELIVTQGGVGLVRAERATIRQGGAGAILGERIDVHQSLIRLIIARGPVSISQGIARLVVGGDVEIGERGFAGLVIARTVTGQGRILLDWRAGLAVGAAFALVWGLLRGRPR